MSYDELELDRMGDRRTATFFCISDTDSTYNFLVALAFSQMFNLLCERADNVHGGRLPHHVRVLWDEAANTGQVPGLEKLVAVIRSREISLCLLYQQLAQCKAIYQDWKDGEITQQEYRDMKATYDRQINEVSDVLARLTAERAELANGVDKEHPALVAFKKYQNIDALSRELLIELVDYIKVYENGNISVKFKFADQLRRIAEYIDVNTAESPAWAV